MASFGYGRVSTDRQENGRDGQLARLVEAASRDGASLDEVYFDEDVSGSTPFSSRPRGKVLWDRLQRGDCVYITKVDRGFRSMSDAAFTLEKWKQIGIRFRIVDLGVDLSTPAGEMFFHLLAAFATFERQMIASRTREAIANSTKRNGIHKNARPFGWMQCPTATGHTLVPHEREREIALKALEMRKSGMGWQKAAVSMWRQGYRRIKSGGHYDSRDLARMVAAAEAGFPKIPQESLRASLREAKQPSSSGRCRQKES